MNIKLKRDYIATTTSDILDAITGEIEITLSKPVESDMGWIIIEPNTVNEEQVFFHRRIGTTVFVYGVNRSNPVFHASGSTAMLTNGIDYVNYAIEQSYEQMFIYKKDTNNVVIKGGKYFFPEGNVTIPDLDTSLSLSGKTLTANAVNYVYITGRDYFITTTQNDTDYEVARITTTLGGVITQIERSKVLGIGTQGEKGDEGDKGDTGNGIASISQISSIGLVDTYRITMTNGSYYDFTVENGADGIDGDDGVGIVSVTLQSTVGKVKTYRILFTNATTFDFSVTDGNDGEGTGDMLASIYDPANGAKQIAFDDEVEHDSNKKTGMTGNESSNTFYLTAKAVYDWVVSLGYSTDSSVVHKAGNVNETITGIKTFSSSPIVPAPSAGTDAVNKTYVDNLVVGLLDDRGSYNASVNTFPTTGGSGTAGAILKGDIWFISVAGTLGGVAVEVGDSLRALVDTPGQTATNWSIIQVNINYVPENVANKVTTFTGNTLSNTLFPSVKAIVDWCTTVLNGVGLTFQNKTISLGNNTITGTKAQFNTAVTDGDIVFVGDTISTRLNPRLNQATNYTTSVTMYFDAYDEYDITAQAGALLFNNPSGTPVNGQKRIIRIKDNGTARALTYGTQFASGVSILPTTTIVSKKLWIGLEWDSTDSKWYCIASGSQT